MKQSHATGRTLTRRSFLAGAAGMAGGLAACRTTTTIPVATGGASPVPRKLNLAVIGAGGRGADNIKGLAATGAVSIVALCDCDIRQASEAFSQYPNAARYSDWRRLLDAETAIDAVVVSTPDHNHAVISIAAMQRGKHVYCEKPLAHSIWEAREMARVAAERRVVTQMGTQGHAYEGTRRAVETLRSGIIGDITELHVWTDRPAGWWPQGVTRPVETPPVPAGLDWDVWLGPAHARPYNPAYVPFKWRGFWDFGTGAIGDMGVHNLDTAFWALELGVPTSVVVKDCSPGLADARMKETAPLWSILELQFAAQKGRPAVRMTWYDGGKLPPQELFMGEPLIEKDGGSLVIGTKGTLFTRTWHGGVSEQDMFVLLPRKQFVGLTPPTPTLPRTASHYHEWVEACLGQGSALSNFGYASVLTEALLVGNLALRTGKAIEWNGARMRAVSCPEADPFIRPDVRSGWSL
jgi:predicted dehydrogenase